MNITTLNIESVTADPQAQPRVQLDQFIVDDYATAMKLGAEFPPVTVFSDGERHWLADGFHRHAAARQAGLTTLQAEVRPGGLRDAVLFSCAANGQHGLRRSNADKRKSVLILLLDSDWSQWSD